MKTKSVRECAMSSQVVSLSGGKDSTAMLLMMLERGERVDEVITCDTGKEFPEMYEHLERLERETGLTFTRLRASAPFDELMFNHVMQKGKRKGERGYGWPRPNCRWCTSKLKNDVIARYLRGRDGVVQCVGIAADEPRRVGNKRYPLVEWGVTEEKALEYCYNRGYTWGGLYDMFGRVSCWCCPLKSLAELRTLRRERPELWARLMKMDERAYNSFRRDYTLAQIEDLFSREERQTEPGQRTVCSSTVIAAVGNETGWVRE